MTVFWILIAATGFFAYRIYNKLIKNRELVKEGFSGIDVQLKRRFDLIPRIADTVKAYASHEKNLMIAVTEIRSDQYIDEKDPEKRQILEKEISQSLAKLLITVENYPALKAGKNFLELQEELVAVEDEIQMARRYYNGTVRDHNIVVESFPGNLLANIFHFKPAFYFELDSLAEMLPPEISLSKAS